MKRIIAVLLLLVAQVGKAADYGTSWERPLPKITTEQELWKYQRARKITGWTAVGLGVVTVGALAYSSRLSHKAANMDVRGPLTFFPDPNGGGGGYLFRPVIPESQERKTNLNKNARHLREAAIVTGLASLVLATLTISITF